MKESCLPEKHNTQTAEKELKLKINMEQCKKIHFTFSVQLHMFSNVRFHSLY
jgi:hypothetical protein